MKIYFAFFLALGAAGFLPVASPAQAAPNEPTALSGPSTTNQTTIRSDNGAEFHYKTKTYIYRGNVRVDSPQMKLTCELLTIEAPEFEDGKFNRATAETNVVIDWVDNNGTNHATGEKAVYTFVATNLVKLPEKQYSTNSGVVLTGNPYAMVGGAELRSDPIIWDRVKDAIYAPKLQETVLTTKTNLFDMGATSRTNSASKTNSPRK
jgi:lipopolysaccharide export system protein LptA